MATDVTWLGVTDTSWAEVSNWSDGAVPEAGDSVSIPAGSPNIDSGLDQSAIALASVYIEQGYVGTIGDTSTVPATCLVLDCDSLRIDGKCTAYLDLQHGDAIDVTISASASARAGGYGIFLKGDALDDLVITGGTVGIATFLEEEMAVTDLRISGSASVLSGRNSTVTNILMKSGTYRHKSENATTLFRQESGVATVSYCNGGAFTQRGGLLLLNDWTGTVTLVVEGGFADLTQGGMTRTLSALTVDPGGSCRLDADIVTVTTYNKPTKPGTISVASYFVAKARG